MTAPLLTAAEAAERLGISVSQVRHRVASREWPCTRFGRSVRFSEDNLAEIVRMSAQPAVTYTPRIAALQRGRRSA